MPLKREDMNEWSAVIHCEAKESTYINNYNINETAFELVQCIGGHRVKRPKRVARRLNNTPESTVPNRNR